MAGRGARQRRHGGGSVLGRAGDAGACAHYLDPAYYSKTYAARRADVEYYVDLARRNGGPILEYGVGNGRVAIPIARAGMRVIGVDLSRPMLADLNERLSKEPPAVRRNVRLVHGDMRRVRLARRFPLVIAPFNVVLHLYTRAELEQFLAHVRGHLRPTGRFVFDFSLPQPQDLMKDPTRWYGAPRLRYPSTGTLVRYKERFAYDALKQLMLVEIEFTPEQSAEPAWSVPLTHRQFFPREIEALLHYNGFDRIRFIPNFGRKPVGFVDSLVVTCKARRR